jgi:hypothetical protein
MGTCEDPRQTMFNNDGNVGVQAQQYIVYGDNIIQSVSLSHIYTLKVLLTRTV